MAAWMMLRMISSKLLGTRWLMVTRRWKAYSTAVQPVQGPLAQGQRAHWGGRHEGAPNMWVWTAGRGGAGQEVCRRRAQGRWLQAALTLG